MGFPQQLWTNQYLSDLASEGEIQISTDIKCIYVRFPMSVTQGTTIYSFEDPLVVNPIQRLTGIIRITWQGWTVHPVFQNQLRNMVVPLHPEEGEIQSSRPFMYMRMGYGLNSIKFFPAPNLTIAYDNSNINTQIGIQNNIVVSGWRIADPTGSLYRIPDYVRERLVRYYVMSRAYKKEGKGQDLMASKYYDDKYNKLLARFKKIVENLFKSRTHGFGDMFLNQYGQKPPHPRLPSNFGTPISGFDDN